jgi:hypothetical protein
VDLSARQDALAAAPSHPCRLVTATGINPLIGSPAYAGRVHADHVSAPLVFQRERVAFTPMAAGAL